ncbi:hypothetical protein CTI16_09380 [Prevotella intermedia]|uniref:Uncharacterized protein n=1 Tax=Prevotella intermedia TaxID=28131 RepID=A0AAJ3RGB6_PREIN|nr:hypothetical protein [Prevotella intermedia]PIK17223.1 hypothetical protein CTI16_09380 [Prevotella intermedia]
MLQTQLVTPYLKENDTIQKQAAQLCLKLNLPERRHHKATERQRKRHRHAAIFPFRRHRPPNVSQLADIHSLSVAPNLLACRLLLPQMSAATYYFVGSCAQNILNIKLLHMLK